MTLNCQQDFYLGWFGAETFGLGLYNIGEVLEAIGGHNVIKLVSNNVMHEASLFLVQAPKIYDEYELGTNAPKPIMMINLEQTDDKTSVQKIACRYDYV